jgi:hypothetical protein
VQLAIDLGAVRDGSGTSLLSRFEAVDLLGRGADSVVRIVEERVCQL